MEYIVNIVTKCQRPLLCPEGHGKVIYRPVPMNELKTFLFPEDDIEEKTLKAIPLSFRYA